MSITVHFRSQYETETNTYASDLISLDRLLRMEGRGNSSYALDQIRELKLSHVQNFINVSLQFTNSTKSSFTLDKTAIKNIFTNYQAIDITETTAAIVDSYQVRGRSIDQNALSSAVTSVNSYYSTALLQIEAM